MEVKDFIFNEEDKKFYIPGEKKQTYEEYFKTLKIKENFQCFTIGNLNNIKFSKNSKNIKFKGNGYDEKIFICNKSQVLYILNLFKFKRYKVIKNKNNNNDYNNNDYNKKDDNNNDDNIILSDNLNFDEIIYLENLLNQEDFIKAKTPISNLSKVSLDLLSLSFYEYQKYDYSKIEGEFEMSNERQEFFEELHNLVDNKKFIPICGPKSIGKTTTLLYYLKKYYPNEYFYINLTLCKKLLNEDDNEKLCLCICKELYNCMSFKEVQKCYNYIYQKKYKQIMDLVIDIMDYMDKNFPCKSFIFAIDQYKEKTDKKYQVIEQIMKITNSNDKFIVIVCSSINEYDFRNSIEKKMDKAKNGFYLDFLFVNKLIKVNPTNLKEKNFTDGEKNLLNQFGDLYLYYQKILENKKNNEKNIFDIKKEIMLHIITEIRDYFNEKDNKKIIDMIRAIHDNIGKEKKFIDLYDKLKLFPLKFFNISIKGKNLFQINELKKDTKLTVTPTNELVIDCINQIFNQGKIDLKKSKNNEITFNIQKSKKSSELEENFNDFIWIYRTRKQFYECNIKDRVQISSLLDMNDDDGKIIKNSIKELKDISDSILIVQEYENAKHFDTAILKLVKNNNNEKLYNLYLFQETLKKQSEERLNDSTLNNDKTSLKFLFFLKCSIILNDIYFSYVFDEGDLDNTTINYCKDNNINYLILGTKLEELKNSNIDPKIKSRFSYTISKEMNLKQEYLLSNLDIDFSLDKKDIKKQHDKLNNFLEKKRKLKSKLQVKSSENKELKDKIKKIQKYVNNVHKNKEIEDKLIEEFLMLDEDEDIIGISYIIDKKTKNYLREINFSEVEKNNLFNLTSFYNNDLEILKIVNISLFSQIPNYDCAIIFVSQDCKLFIDEKNKKSYSLYDMSASNSIRIDGKLYLIKFALKRMILRSKTIEDSKVNKFKSFKKSSPSRKSHSTKPHYSSKKNDI